MNASQPSKKRRKSTCKCCRSYGELELAMTHIASNRKCPTLHREGTVADLATHPAVPRIGTTLTPSVEVSLLDILSQADAPPHVPPPQTTVEAGFILFFNPKYFQNLAISM